MFLKLGVIVIYPPSPEFFVFPHSSLSLQRSPSPFSSCKTNTCSPKHWQLLTNIAISLIGSPGFVDCFRLDIAAFSAPTQARAVYWKQDQSMPRQFCTVNVLLFSRTDVCQRGWQMCPQRERAVPQLHMQWLYSLYVTVLKLKLWQKRGSKELHRSLFGLALSDACVPCGGNWVWVLISFL